MDLERRNHAAWGWPNRPRLSRRVAKAHIPGGPGWRLLEATGGWGRTRQRLWHDRADGPKGGGFATPACRRTTRHGRPRDPARTPRRLRGCGFGPERIGRLPETGWRKPDPQRRRRTMHRVQRKADRAGRAPRRSTGDHPAEQPQRPVQSALLDVLWLRLVISAAGVEKTLLPLFCCLLGLRCQVCAAGWTLEWGSRRQIFAYFHAAFAIVRLSPGQYRGGEAGLRGFGA